MARTAVECNGPRTQVEVLVRAIVFRVCGSGKSKAAAYRRALGPARVPPALRYCNESVSELQGYRQATRSVKIYDDR